jgi:hypothetical protein
VDGGCLSFRVLMRFLPGTARDARSSRESPDAPPFARSLQLGLAQFSKSVTICISLEGVHRRTRQRDHVAASVRRAADTRALVLRAEARGHQGQAAASRTRPQALVEQGVLQYVEERRKIGKPLFYEPARARGGKGANPQWQKVGERLAEWVRESLKVTDVQPNHGWRHLWREIVRGTKMKPELCDYMCGHESKSGTGARYGKRKVPVLAKEMSLFPRFKVPALNRAPAAHRRTRRTRAQIAADVAAKGPRQAKRAKAA